MVEDSEIKTNVSPFAMREGELKVFDGKDGYVSINQIIQKINVGHINELHFQILEFVNEFEFITSRQLMKMLALKGFEVDSQDKLNNKLNQLVKVKILTRYYFNSDDGKGIYRIKKKKKMGKYLLNSRGIECKWQPTDNTKTVAMIKKRLAGNQIIISYMTKVKTFAGYVAKPPMKAKSLGKTFKVAGGRITLAKANKSIDFIFEVVRREDEWEKKIIDKLNLYNDFYTNFVSGDSEFKTIPQLILVCEDEKHMAECFKVLTINKVEIDKIKIYYTTDLRQNEEDLSNSLVYFRLDSDTNKYKMENVTVKALSN